MASIVMGILFLLAALNQKSIFFLMISFMPLTMGTICAFPLPIKTGFLYSDGGRWSRIRNVGQQSDEEKSLLDLTVLSSVHGESTLPTFQTIAPLLKSQEAPFRYYGHYYRYLIAKTEQDAAQMQEHLECLEKLKSGY